MSERTLLADASDAGLQENPFYLSLKGGNDAAAGKDSKRDSKQAVARKK
jgi:hypothetical protein